MKPKVREKAWQASGYSGNARSALPVEPVETYSQTVVQHT